MPPCIKGDNKTGSRWCAYSLQGYHPRFERDIQEANFNCMFRLGTKYTAKTRRFEATCKSARHIRNCVHALQQAITFQLQSNLTESCSPKPPQKRQQFPISTHQGLVLHYTGGKSVSCLRSISLRWVRFGAGFHLCRRRQAE